MLKAELIKKVERLQIQGDEYYQETLNLKRELKNIEKDLNSLEHVNKGLLDNMKEISNAIVLYKNIKYPNASLLIDGSVFGYIQTSVIGDNAPDTEELLFVQHIYTISTRICN